MQKNSLKTFLFVLSVAVFLLSGCKKYEDGPYLSFKSKSKRLVGEWKLVKVNGEERPSDATKIYFQFDDDGTFFYTEKNTSFTNIDEGKWNWESSKEIIEVELWFPDHVERNDYKVFRLTSDELWVEDSNNDELEFEID